MRRDLFVYLSGPITAKHGYSVEENVASALNVYFDLLKRGIPAFCPHLNAAFPSAFLIDYDVWMAYDYAVIDRSTHVLLLPRWQESKGAIMEKAYAEERGVPVVMSVEDIYDRRMRRTRA